MCITTLIKKRSSKIAEKTNHIFESSYDAYNTDYEYHMNQFKLISRADQNIVSSDKYFADIKINSKIVRVEVDSVRVHLFCLAKNSSLSISMSP